MTIHCIKAHQRLFEVCQELYEDGSEVSEILKGNGYRQVLQMHAYEADVKFARKIMELFPSKVEFYFSIGIHMKDEINLPNIQNLPKDRIIIETDCPHNGSMPYMLSDFVNKVKAHCKGSNDGFGEQAYDNSLRMIQGINA